MESSENTKHTKDGTTGSVKSADLETGVADVVDLPLGTVHILDLTHNFSGKHASGDKEIILNPMPSSDPEDPLNWSRRRKGLATLCAIFYTWCICVSCSSVYSVFDPIFEQMGIGFGQLNAGTGYMFLLFGWGLLFWQPLALKYGRRGIYLISLLGTMAFNIWAAYGKNNGQWIAHNILLGFFGASSEALVEITIADLWFTHQRGTFMAIYVMTLFGGQLGTIPAGFITVAQGWPWVFYWCGILNAIGFVFCFFFMEETMYVRDNPNKVTPRKTYWQKLALFQKGQPINAKQLLLQPFKILRLPLVIWAGVMYGFYLCWFALMNATVSEVLSAPPYNFSAEMVGVAYIGQIIGLYLSGTFGGKLADAVYLWLARRNNGVGEPEFRLYLFLPAAVLAPAGLILWGVGAAHGVHWVGLLFGLGITGLTIPMAGSLCVTYVVDCYREIAGQSLVTLVLFRNTMDFGFNYSVSPFVAKSGLQNVFVMWAMVAFASTMSFILVVKYGRRLRIAGRPIYEELRKEASH